MAHVRTIGKVVGPEAPNEKLVEKGGFVGGAAGGVEVRPVGILERAEMCPDQVERVIPADRLVVIRRVVITHRFRQTALFLQPVIALLFQFANGVGGEEFRCHPALRELEGDGFRAVLAELERSWYASDPAMHIPGSQSRRAGSSKAAPPSPSTLCSAREALAQLRGARPSLRRGFHKARTRHPPPVLGPERLACWQRLTEAGLTWRVAPDGLTPDRLKFWRAVVASIPHV